MIFKSLIAVAALMLAASVSAQANDWPNRPIKLVVQPGKLLRLWAIPDNAAAWQRLQQLGVDIINTDKVGECREFFFK